MSLGIGIGISAVLSGSLPGTTMPIFQQDFTSATPDTPAGFTRTTAAYAFNSTAAYQSYGVNVPRFSYSAASGAPLGLHMEEAALEAIRNPGFAGGSAGVWPTNVTYDGNANGVSLTSLGVFVVNGVQRLRVQASGTATAVTRLRLYFDTKTNPQAATTSTTLWRSSFNTILTSGTIPAGVIPSIILDEFNSSGSILTTNLYKAPAGLRSSYVEPASESVITRLSNTTNAAYVALGLQLEVPSGTTVSFVIDFALPSLRKNRLATSRMGAAQASRALDSAVSSPAWISQPAGTVVFEDHIPHLDWTKQHTLFSMNDGTPANAIEAVMLTTGYIQVTVTVAGVSTVITTANASGSSDRFIFGVTYGSLGVKLALNGIVQIGYTSAAIPTVTSFRLADNVAQTASLNGYVRKLKIYNSQLENLDLAVITGRNLTPVKGLVEAGQSNINGQAPNADIPAYLSAFYGSTAMPNLRIFFKSTTRNSFIINGSTYANDGQWYYLSPVHDDTNKLTHQTIGASPVYTPESTNTTHGFELEYGYQFANAFPSEELRIIKLGVGGSIIQRDWDITSATPDKNWFFFKNYIFYTAVAQLALEGKRLADDTVFNWGEGESASDDGSITQATYYGWLQSLVARVRGELGLPNAKIVFNGMSTRSPANTKVNLAQQQIVANYPNCSIVVTNGSDGQAALPLQADNLHYTSPGYSELARRLFKKAYPTASVI